MRLVCCLMLLGAVGFCFSNEDASRLAPPREALPQKEFCSEASQDQFVYTILCDLLGKMDSGTYLEIGAGHPKITNNTYFFEKMLGWTGVSIDISTRFKSNWQTVRKNPLVIANALEVEYIKLLESFPPVIDYLSLDIDRLYDVVLQKIPFDKHIFKVITIEHDAYRFGDVYREKERKILTALGYHMLCGNVCINKHAFEDWWVHPSIFPSRIFSELTSLDLNSREHSQILQILRSGL